MANARPIASSAASSTAIQNRPGATRARIAAVGVEGEREQQDHDQPEREDLRERDPGPGLDPQVLARHEPGLAPEAHDASSTSRGDEVQPESTRTSRVASARARSSSWEAITTVRPSAGAAAHDLVEHLPALGVEARVGLVEQQQLRVAHQRRAEREPAALAGRELRGG